MQALVLKTQLNNSTQRSPIAVFLPTLEGGGAEKVMLTLINGFCRRGIDVDVVLAQARGAYLSQLDPRARVIDFKVKRVLFTLMPLVLYLRRTKPRALLSAMDHCNVVALLARGLARVPTRVVISVHSNFTNNNANSGSAQGRSAKYWVRPFYHRADAIVAVSAGVAADLCASLGFGIDRIRVIYNPVVTQEFLRMAAKPLNHRWAGSCNIPLVLGVGRLTAAKDFSTLLRAFVLVRAQRNVRLVILGEGEERPALEGLIGELGLRDDVEMPGFVDNPFSYMHAASLFVLSSLWEGFGNVLAEALACGTAVVSTDCPSGPSEILEYGRWGSLAPVSDHAALANAMLFELDRGPRENVQTASRERFAEDKIIDQYLATILS